MELPPSLPLLPLPPLPPNKLIVLSSLSKALVSYTRYSSKMDEHISATKCLCK